MDSALIHTIQNNFTKAFGTRPLMVFSPGRINLIGEHVDYNDGFVFPAAIDKGIALGIALSNDSNSQTSIAIANDVEESHSFNINDVAPLAHGGWRNYIIGVVAELNALGCTLQPFHLLFGGNIPVGAGLSSSAALENAVVLALNTLFNLQLSKQDMIQVSQRAEHRYAGVKCGIMDQYASMFGKKDHFLLLDCKTLEAEAFHIDLAEYDLILINTNVQHNLSDSTYNTRRTLCETVAQMLHKKALRDVSLVELDAIKSQLSEEEYSKVRYVIEEIERTAQASKAIINNDMETLGALLYQSHKGLSEDYEVSCEELDFLVAKAKASGVVLGARMMGGGFGGCTINICKKEATDRFLAETSRAYTQQFGYGCSVIKVTLSQGTHVLN